MSTLATWSSWTHSRINSAEGSGSQKSAERSALFLFLFLTRLARSHCRAVSHRGHYLLFRRTRLAPLAGKILSDPGARTRRRNRRQLDKISNYCSVARNQLTSHPTGGCGCDLDRFRQFGYHNPIPPTRFFAIEGPVGGRDYLFHRQTMDRERCDAGRNGNHS